MYTSSKESLIFVVVLSTFWKLQLIGNFPSVMNSYYEIDGGFVPSMFYTLMNKKAC